MKALRRIGLGLLIVAASLFNAHSASFDCSKASTAVEGSICANPTLSVLDEQLAAAYKQAVNASPNPAALLDTQRAWLKTLNACGANAPCLTSAYEQRITVLNAASSQPLAPSPQQVTPTQTTAAPLFPTPPQQNQSATPSTQASSTGRGDQPKIQTVVVEGVGIDVQGAAQNAAQNALTNVVGSLIDTTNMVEKRTQITDGIRTQTKDIKSSIKEYSQGSIQSFEILDTKNDSGLFRVTAKVSIRIEDFRAYIKKLAEGETAVSGGLFTQAQSMATQKTNKLNLLNDLLRPLIGGEVVQFAVQPPIPLANSKYKGGDQRLDFIIKENGEENVFFVKVIASLDPNFLANMKKVVQATAAAHVSVPQTKIGDSRGSHCTKFNSDFNPNLAASIGFYDVGFNRQGNGATISYVIDSSKFVDLYMIDGVGKALLTSQRENEEASTSLEIAILGANGSVLQKEQIYYIEGFGGRSGPPATERIALYPDDFLNSNDLPWNLVGRNVGGCNFEGPGIVTRRTFTLGIAIAPAALKDAQKIVVRIIN